MPTYDYGDGVSPGVTFNRGVEITTDSQYNEGNNFLAVVTSFAAEAGLIYHFRFVGAYTAAATTTGSRWTVSYSGTPNMLAYTARWTLTGTTEYVGYETTKELPAAASATSLTDGNIAVVEGFIQVPADGDVNIEFASEITGSRITVLAGARLEWEAAS